MVHLTDRKRNCGRKDKKVVSWFFDIFYNWFLFKEEIYLCVT